VTRLKRTRRQQRRGRKLKRDPPRRKRVSVLGPLSNSLQNLVHVLV